jgi:hypothetical protein
LLVATMGEKVTFLEGEASSKRSWPFCSLPDPLTALSGLLSW